MNSFWQGKRVCVTGGSGFLGFHLVRQLLERGAGVRVLSLPPRPDHPLNALAGVDRCFGDILDAKHVRRSLADSEVIFHTAGLVAVWGTGLAQMHAVHVEGTRNVLAAAPPSARVVHTSSIVAVGASRPGRVLDEDAAFNLGRLKVAYVQAKRAAECAALASAARGQDVVVVNPGYMVGPEDYEPSVMGRLCVRFWRGRILMAPPGGYNLVDVRDVAAGHLLAAERGRGGRRYILGGENLTLQAFMGLLGRIAGWQPRGLPIMPPWGLAAVARLAHVRALWTRREPYPAIQAARMQDYFWFCRSDRAARDLGYRARPVKQSLSDAYAWHQTHERATLRGLPRWWLRPAA